MLSDEEGERDVLSDEEGRRLVTQICAAESKRDAGARGRGRTLNARALSRVAEHCSVRFLICSCRALSTRSRARFASAISRPSSSILRCAAAACSSYPSATRSRSVRAWRNIDAFSDQGRARISISPVL